MPGYQIQPAQTPADMAAATKLFLEYEASIEIDLCFQDFEAELASLPGKYAPPSGALLLARAEDGSAIGCVALRPFRSGCEMKRLYVSPEGRGMGLGDALVRAILEKAAGLGYSEMCLDTLSTMTEAISLYKKNGFERIGAYYETPIDSTVFMSKKL